jgi:zinc protease
MGLRKLFALLPFLVLTACPLKKNPAPTVTSSATPREMPDALTAPAFKVPDIETATLSNGLKVMVASNHEVPLWDVRIAFNVGAHLDPVEKSGLAEITFAMMKEGAGKRSSEDIARDLKQMASRVSSGAASDGASVTASGIKRNLADTLDIWADVLRTPTFQSSEWDIMKPQWIAKINAAKKAPSGIANRVYNHLIYGDTYRGRIHSEADYTGLTTQDMRDFHARWVGPENAVIIAGGDITAEELVPLLEQRIGQWSPKTEVKPEPVVTSRLSGTPVLYFVDSPGAAQSVLRTLTVIGDRKAPDFFSLKLAIQVLGGTFMSRVNMNLREDKGYSYGARCFDSHRYGPAIGMCNTSVQTAVTGPAMDELRRELTEFVGERPATEEELSYMKSSEINGYPAKYETTDSLLNEQVTIWRYGLPQDWPERFLPGVNAVTLAGANEAFAKYWSPDRTIWLVVGDKESIWDSLKAFGLDIIELDTDGQPVGEHHGH